MNLPEHIARSRHRRQPRAEQPKPAGHRHVLPSVRGAVGQAGARVPDGLQAVIRSLCAIATFLRDVRTAFTAELAAIDTHLADACNDPEEGQ